MVHQNDPFRAWLDQVSSRKKTDQSAFVVDNWQRAAAHQQALDLANLVFGMAVVEFAAHDMLNVQTQVDQAHGGEGVVASTDNQHALATRGCQGALGNEQIASDNQG